MPTISVWQFPFSLTWNYSNPIFLARFLLSPLQVSYKTACMIMITQARECINKCMTDLLCCCCCCREAESRTKRDARESMHFQQSNLLISSSFVLHPPPSLDPPYRANKPALCLATLIEKRVINRKLTFCFFFLFFLSTLLSIIAPLSPLQHQLRTQGPL